MLPRKLPRVVHQDELHDQVRHYYREIEPTLVGQPHGTTYEHYNKYREMCKASGFAVTNLNTFGIKDVRELSLAYIRDRSFNRNIPLTRFDVHWSMYRAMHPHLEHGMARTPSDYVSCMKHLLTYDVLRMKPDFYENKYKVVVFKHVVPFDGCFWEYQAVVVDPDGELHDVGWRATRKLHNVATTLDEFKEFYYADDISVSPWDEGVYDHVREDLVPAFWNFAAEHQLPFVWDCKHCGKTENRPAHATTYCPGGVQISASAWYCEECYCNLTCGYCGSLNDPDEQWWSHDEELEVMYEAGYCPQCQRNRDGDKYERADDE